MTALAVVAFLGGCYLVAAPGRVAELVTVVVGAVLAGLGVGHLIGVLVS